MENHSSEESGDCESVQNPLGEDCIMKGPQVTKQQPWLHEALSVAGLIVALCLLIQTRPYPAWEFLFCGTQTTSCFNFHSTTPKSNLWNEPLISLSWAEGQGLGLATTAQYMISLLKPPLQETWYLMHKRKRPLWQAE